MSSSLISHLNLLSVCIMDLYYIPLVVGGVVGVLVLLAVLYVMCKSCNSQSQGKRDIESGQESHDGRTLSRRLLYLIFKTERTNPPYRRPEQRGAEARSSVKRPLLHKAAIMKHIHPACNSDLDAIHFSTERDKKYSTEVNCVFKISPNEFEETMVNGETQPVGKTALFICK